MAEQPEWPRWSAFCDELLTRTGDFLGGEEHAFTAGMALVTHYSARLLAALVERDPDSRSAEHLFHLYMTRVKDLYALRMSGNFEMGEDNGHTMDHQFHHNLANLIQRHIREDVPPDVLMGTLCTHLAFLMASVLCTEQLFPEQIDEALREYCTHFTHTVWSMIRSRDEHRHEDA
jgi:hypothetical protein